MSFGRTPPWLYLCMSWILFGDIVPFEASLLKCVSMVPSNNIKTMAYCRVKVFTCTFKTLKHKHIFQNMPNFPLSQLSLWPVWWSGRQLEWYFMHFCDNFLWQPYLSCDLKTSIRFYRLFLFVANWLPNISPDFCADPARWTRSGWSWMGHFESLLWITLEVCAHFQCLV